MGSRREFTRILGLEGFRIETIEWAGDGPNARVQIGIERGGSGVLVFILQTGGACRQRWAINATTRLSFART